MEAEHRAVGPGRIPDGPHSESVSPTATVLVLDGEQRAALAVVRSLGRNGCRVDVGACERGSVAGGSRYARSESLLPNPMCGSEVYAASVARLARDRGADLVLPVSEASTIAVLEFAEQFSGITIPVPDLNHFRRACDKEAVLAAATDLGIAVPTQWVASGRPGEPLAVPEARFPVVVKPARSVVGGREQRRKMTVRYADTPAELHAILGDLGPEAGPFLLQERVEGPGLGIFLLRWRSQILASFAHRRIREKPPSGGVSTCCESISAPAELLEQSVALLEALDWNGVAMIEYKEDLHTGKPYLMEVNPRFWGSLQLAIDSGVDFPWLLVRAALGDPPAPSNSWRVGQRSRWAWGEVDHLLTRLRRSRAELHLPASAPGLLSTAASILVPWRPRQRSDVFRLSDPWPAVRETVAWVRGL